MDSVSKKYAFSYVFAPRHDIDNHFTNTVRQPKEYTLLPHYYFSMQYIVVVECASSGQMYIDDIIEMGYRPLVIYVYFDVQHACVSSNIEYVKKIIANKAEIIQIKKNQTLEELLDQLKDYEIVAVVPGSEAGVGLADTLNKALGFKGNNPATSYMRCTKVGMNEALVKAGLRHIESTVVTSADQVKKFWKDNNLRKSVIKFSESSGTVGLKICDSLDDSIGYFNHLKTGYTLYGSSDVPILMQEYIGGTEYVVNCLSVDGKHKITDVWRYEKILQPDGVLVYDTMVLVDRLVPGMQDLLQYTYKVLDAVGMKNGFSHNEFKIDEKGPVLIEINARVMGGNLTREYLDEIFGSHMTDITLRSLLEPTFFDNFMLTPYLPRKSAMFKFSIAPYDIKADLGPFFDLIRHLNSYRELIYFGKSGIQEYPRTIDLETSPFFVRLTNEDYGGLKRDYELIRLLEERYCDMLFVTKVQVEGAKHRTDLDKIIEKFPLSREFALIEDDKLTVIQYGKRCVSEDWEIYDGVIFAACGATDLTQRFRQLMRCMNHIRKGGPVFIVPESYENLPYGAVCAEVVMSVMGVDAKIPPSISDGILFGIKR